VSTCHTAWPWSRLSGRQRGAPVRLRTLTTAATARATTAAAGGRGNERRRHSTPSAATGTAISEASCTSSAPGGIGPW
jgi:hypothetical protein